MNCKNCGSEVTSKFCSECGQKTSVDRFKIKYLFLSFLDSMELEQGFIPGLWNMIYKPGTAIRNYVDGQRVGFYNPIKLFLIIGAIATFLTFEFKIFNDAGEGVLNIFGLAELDGFVYYSGKYFSFFTLTSTPVFALFSWLIFADQKRNYIENLVMNIYLSAGQFLITCLYSPVLINVKFDWVDMIYGVLNYAYNLWVLIVFFNAWNIKGVAKSLLAVVLPMIFTFFMNYLLYILAPKEFWQFLDLTFG